MKKLFFITLISIVAVTFLIVKNPSPPSSNLIWPADTSHLRDRLTTLGLPALITEGDVLHTHQHLDIFINGQAVLIPAGIGIGPNGTYLAPIHVHDTTGILHVESPEAKIFTLGQFFGIWGVDFNDQCIGKYCTNDDNHLRLYINGQAMSNHFADVPLAAHQEIVITFGTDAQLPKPIVSSYQFPPDY